MPEEEPGDWNRGTPYHRMSDEKLDEFIQGFPRHVEIPAAVAERQRRRDEQAANDRKKLHEETQRLARWAIRVSSLGVLVGITFGVIQCRARNHAATANSPAAPLVNSTPSPSPQ